MSRLVVIVAIVLVALISMLLIVVATYNATGTKTITKTSSRFPEYIKLGKLKLTKFKDKELGIIWVYEANITPHVWVRIWTSDGYRYHIEVNYDWEWLKQQYVKYFKINKTIIDYVKKFHGIDLEEILNSNKTITINKMLITEEYRIEYKIPWYAIQIYNLTLYNKIPLAIKYIEDYAWRLEPITLHDPFINEVLVPVAKWILTLKARFLDDLTDILTSMVLVEYRKTGYYPLGTSTPFPLITLAQGYGDCEDASILVYTVLKAANLNAALLYWVGNPPHMSAAIAETEIHPKIPKLKYHLAWDPNRGFYNTTIGYYIVWDTGGAPALYTQKQVEKYEKRKLVYLVFPLSIDFIWTITH